MWATWRSRSVGRAVGVERVDDVLAVGPRLHQPGRDERAGTHRRAVPRHPQLRVDGPGVGDEATPVVAPAASSSSSDVRPRPCSLAVSVPARKSRRRRPGTRRGRSGPSAPAGRRTRGGVIWSRDRPTGRGRHDLEVGTCDDPVEIVVLGGELVTQRVHADNLPPSRGVRRRGARRPATPGCRSRIRPSWPAPCLAATFLAGAFLAGARLATVFLATAFFAGAFLAAAFLAGAFLAAAFLAGAFLATRLLGRRLLGRRLLGDGLLGRGLLGDGLLGRPPSWPAPCRGAGALLAAAFVGRRPSSPEPSWRPRAFFATAWSLPSSSG